MIGHRYWGDPFGERICLLSELRSNIRLMDPVTVWGIAKTAGEVSKRLYDFQKSLKSREEKQQVDAILDTLTDLKHSASQLEDENRELREKLRFKSDEFEFRTPYRYHKDRPTQPLCVKCFSKNIEAQMSALVADGFGRPHKSCLVCENIVYEWQ